MSSHPNPTSRQAGGTKQPRFAQPVNNVRALDVDLAIDPAYNTFLQRLASPLRPFVSCVDGQAHPDFPPNLLAYHLLTAEQLDNLALHYHQVFPPIHETACYPRPIPAWIGAEDEANIDLETKRRRFGHFIGLQGCDTPVTAERATSPSNPLVYRPELDTSESCLSGAPLPFYGPRELRSADTDGVNQMLAHMEREWKEALRCAQEEEGEGILGPK